MLILCVVALCTSIVEVTLGGGDLRLPRIVGVSLCVQQIIYNLMCAYQYERCLRVVMNTRRMIGNEHYAAAFDSAVRRMRWQQFVLFAAGVLEIGFFVYFIVTLKMYYWLFCIAMFVDGVAYSSMAISYLPCFARPKNSSGDTGSKQSNQESKESSSSKKVVLHEESAMLSAYQSQARQTSVAPTDVSEVQ